MGKPKIITKPWGREEWLALNDKYCYKRIYINAGYKTSYQYHEYKHETNYIISGTAEIWLENDDGIVEKTIMKAGDYFNVSPPKKHRVIAITDIILQEVSTPEVDDVIRIEDDTNRVDGRIDTEHSLPAVLILTAGSGTRLKPLTNKVNKSLLPINNKAIISHIIEKYPITYDFVVALGYEGSSVKDYCELIYPNHNFTFVEIDDYNGKNSGPGFSAMMCKSHLQRPFYINTCDCLIDSKLPHLDGNWLGVSPTSLPEKYSTVDIDAMGNIISFKNKSSNGYGLSFIGIAGIVDYDLFWNELESNMVNGEIVNAFDNPKKYSIFKSKSLKWLDTGNLDDLIETRRYLNDTPLSLTKNNHEIIYNINDKFIKYIPNDETLKNKITRGKLLNGSIPDGFGSKGRFMYYNWHEGDTLYKIDNIKIFKIFLSELENKINVKHIQSTEDIIKFYENKTQTRLDLFNTKYPKEYYTEEHNINGVKRRSMKELISKIDYTQLYDNPLYSNFHGDLQFDNVIYDHTNDKFVYIDWRDSFGSRTDAGDIYYDLAKLYGGLQISYSLMKDLNNIELNEGMYNIEYKYTTTPTLLNFISEFESWVTEKGFDLNKIKLITGIIYLNMAPLHDDNFGKLVWYKSIELLDDVTDK